MKSWHIWDFPDNIYIMLKKTREEFFEYMFKKQGGKRAYARFLNLSQRAIIQHSKGYSNYYGEKRTQLIPVWTLKKSLYLIDEKLKTKIENNIELIKLRSSGSPVINPNLPIKESQALYRIIANLIGDGCAGKNKVSYYANTCKKLRERFNKDLSIFGDIKTYERIPNTTSCVHFPKAISEILKHIMDIDFTRPSKLPANIFIASEKQNCAFLQALFDDEGYISSELAISMKNFNLIIEIKKLLEDVGIKSNKIYRKKKENMHILKIKKESYHAFKNKIGFNHPKKRENLEFAFKTIKRNKIQRTRLIKQTRSIIITMLKNKPMFTLEIANSLLFTIPGVRHHLRVLENQSKIKRTGHKNKIIWKTI